MKDALEAETTASDTVSASGRDSSLVSGIRSALLEPSASLAAVLAVAFVTRGVCEEVVRVGELRVDVA